MKKTLSGWAVFAIMALAMVACNAGSSSNDPKDVTQNFIEAFGKQDFETVGKLTTKESQMMVGLIKSGLEMAKQMGKEDGLNNGFKELEGKKVEYGPAEMDGDNATVSVKADGKESHKVYLKKQDGLWKVDLSLQGLMNMGNDKIRNENITDDDKKQMEDALKLMHPDSLKNALKEAQKSVEEAGKQLEEAAKQLDSPGKE